MDTAEIRSLLRGATCRKVLRGWSGPHVPGSYTICPAEGPTEEQSREFVEGFCLMLRESGVTPLPKPWDV